MINSCGLCFMVVRRADKMRELYYSDNARSWAHQEIFAVAELYRQSVFKRQVLAMPAELHRAGDAASCTAG